MRSFEAVQMLASKLPDQSGYSDALGQLARRLGEWPLLLELAGSTLRNRLRQGDTVDGALSFVNRQVEHLGPVAFDLTSSTYREKAVAITVDLSLKQLGSEDRRKLLELSIFPEDLAVPLGTIAQLWGVPRDEAEALVYRLDDLALLRFDPRAPTVRLHDVMRTYFASNLAKEGNLTRSHVRLIDAWGDLRSLPDGYAWRWITYHLTLAGQDRRLRALLLDFAWIAAKLKATDVHLLASDYDQLALGNPARQLQGALRVSADVLLHDRSQLAGQLHGRLLRTPAPEVRAVLQQALRVAKRPWLRPLMASLVPPGQLLRTLVSHDTVVRSVTVMPDGRRVLSAGADGTLRLWDLESGAQLRSLESHGSGIRAVVALPDGRQILSAGEDGILRLWDLESDALPLAHKAHRGAVRALALLPDGERALSAGDDGTLRLWNFQSDAPSLYMKGHRGAVFALAVLPDGRHVLSGGEGGELLLWDLESDAPPRSLGGGHYTVLSVAVLPDGRRVLSGGDAGTLLLWDLQNDAPPRPLIGHHGGVFAITVLPTGRWALSGGAVGMLLLWDLESDTTPRYWWDIATECLTWHCFRTGITPSPRVRTERSAFGT